ncbi:lysylphosphatidylglycerol synthase domain-containing protein [uncultured Gemmiger sp.]|uniref:lysylphosphatidylglycerol synthase domain-containing protein n=1 Tax=uncultured Gemmiger sp. TaxID=1623490 RepID=UPI0025E5B396|nr:lysylphosphatidylglycerol synthase domain-containing protein [uncultured Gemmiger sp.]
MRTLYLLLALALVLVGHTFRLLRWEQFIRIYERPMRGRMLRGMAGGYALNFVLPFHLGDVFRAVFTGRRMKSGIGFSLATVIMDRFLDVWFVALGFIGFWAAGFGGEVVHRAARYYLVFSLVLAVGLVLVVLLRDWLKKICLAFCGIFNDTLKLDGMMFFWSLINTFKDLGRVKIGRLVVNTLVMWAAYLGSYGALAAALTAAGSRCSWWMCLTCCLAATRRIWRRCCPAGCWAVRPRWCAACWCCGRYCRWSSCGRRRCCPKRCAAQ